MNSRRLSLSSSSMSGRIKKFDTYQHDARTSKRVTPLTQDYKSQHGLSTPTQKPSITFKTTKSYVSPPKSVRKQNSQTQKLALSVIAKTPASGSEVIESQFSLQESSQKPKSSKLHRVFYTFGVFVFLFASFASIQTVLTNRDAKKQIGVLGDQTQTDDQQGVAEGTGNDPAESEVSSQALANYRVSPELPRYLRIPDIGVFARIKHTGITAEGAVDAPRNINDVSWYNEGAKPGNPNGSSLLLGHVSGWSNPGVFKKIDKLKVGMRFEVEKGSGEKLTYEVTRGEKIPLEQVNMSKILGVEVAGEHDLKLMTCSGRYDKDTDQYEERYVVYAKILR